MVNYCFVEGCGRNSKQSRHLIFFSLPKERQRQIQWLKAAGREDLLGKDQAKLAYRICSRHFPPTSIKNRHLCSDAVPSLCLDPKEDDHDNDLARTTHKGIGCNSCGNSIVGFRYKCVTCKDYDLCQKCEMLETHTQHYVLRIPKPLKYKLAADLVKKWQELFKTHHPIPCTESSSDTDAREGSDSSDNEPITKYIRNYDSGLELTDEVRNIIRNEVTRVLETCEKEESIKVDDRSKKTRARKKQSTGEGSVNKKVKTIEIEADDCVSAPEVVFADVNEEFDMKEHHIDVKHETESEGL